MLTNEELQAIKERAEKATPGPWNAVPIVDSYEYVVVGDNKRESVTSEVYERDDAIFIEYAREDVPKLVEALLQERAEVERLAEILHDAYAEILRGKSGRAVSIIEDWGDSE